MKGSGFDAAENGSCAMSVRVHPNRPTLTRKIRVIQATPESMHGLRLFAQTLLHLWIGGVVDLCKYGLLHLLTTLKRRNGNCDAGLVKQMSLAYVGVCVLICDVEPRVQPAGRQSSEDACSAASQKTRAVSLTLRFYTLVKDGPQMGALSRDFCNSCAK